MDFPAYGLNLMSREEPKEQDLLSRLGIPNVDDASSIDCSLKLGPSVESTTHPSTTFLPSPPQVGDYYGLITGRSAFRPWGINCSDCPLSSTDVAGGSNNNYSNNNNMNGFIDYGGSPSLTTCRPPPTIPIVTVKNGGNQLSLNAFPQIVNVSPISVNNFQREKETEPDSDDGSKNGRSCVLCRTTNTPLWRNGPNGHKTLCNACGIRLRKQEKKALGITEPYARPRRS